LVLNIYSGERRRNYVRRDAREEKREKREREEKNAGHTHENCTASPPTSPFFKEEEEGEVKKEEIGG
jgi:hypothetical protein